MLLIYEHNCSTVHAHTKSICSLLRHFFEKTHFYRFSYTALVCCHSSQNATSILLYSFQHTQIELAWYTLSRSQRHAIIPYRRTGHLRGGKPSKTIHMCWSSFAIRCRWNCRFKVGRIPIDTGHIPCSAKDVYARNNVAGKQA